MGQGRRQSDRRQPAACRLPEAVSAGDYGARSGCRHGRARPFRRIRPIAPTRGMRLRPADQRQSTKRRLELQTRIRPYPPSRIIWPSLRTRWRSRPACDGRMAAECPGETPSRRHRSPLKTLLQCLVRVVPASANECGRWPTAMAGDFVSPCRPSMQSSTFPRRSARPIIIEPAPSSVSGPWRDRPHPADAGRHCRGIPRTFGFRIRVVACDKSIEPAALGQDVAEDGVECLHHLRAGRKVPCGFLRAGTGRSDEAGHVGATGVGDVDEASTPASAAP